MNRFNLLDSSQISNRSRQLENPGEATRRQAELVSDLLEELIALDIQLAETADVTRLVDPLAAED